VFPSFPVVGRVAPVNLCLTFSICVCQSLPFERVSFGLVCVFVSLSTVIDCQHHQYKVYLIESKKNRNFPLSINPLSLMGLQGLPYLFLEFVHLFNFGASCFTYENSVFCVFYCCKDDFYD